MRLIWFTFLCAFCYTEKYPPWRNIEGFFFHSTHQMEKARKKRLDLRLHELNVEECILIWLHKELITCRILKKRNTRKSCGTTVWLRTYSSNVYREFLGLLSVILCKQQRNPQSHTVPQSHFMSDKYVS